MKIAIIGANKPDSMEFHLADAFNHIGHQAKIFDIYNSTVFRNSKTKKYALAFDKFLRGYNDKYDNHRFLSLREPINEYDPDLIVCLYKDIHPNFISAIRTKNRRIVHLNPDQMTTLGYQQIFAADYDAWFVKDDYMLSFMKGNMHLNAFHYDEAFNHRFNSKPNIHKEIAEKECEIDVVTYGTLYPYRTNMLLEIIKAGVNVKMYGTVPHRFFKNAAIPYCTGKYIIGDEKAEVLYGAKIALNTLHYGEVDSVNCRFFEINGCGAFQLCDYRPILDNLLPIDAELVSYRNVDEAIEKIKYYLSHPNERHDIAKKIYSHFLSNYTYDHLVKKILKTIETL